MWQIGGFYSSTGIISGIGSTGANRLLLGETDGYAIDATTAGGTVSVKDTGTPANNLSNAALNSSNLIQAGTSPKYVIWNDGTIHTVSAGQVAQEYDVAAGKFGILVEPAATNLQKQSEAFSNAEWQKPDVTVTADNTTAPDGSSTADKLEATTTGSNRFLRTGGGATPFGGAGTYTVSCFFKAATVGWVCLEITDAAANGAATFFDLTNGVKGSDVTTGGTWTVAASTITSVGNGWYRCTVAVVANANAYLQIQIADGDNDLAVTAGDSIYGWGAQAETGTIASSYIPTLGSTVTRARDNLSVGATVPYSDTAGTMVAYVKHYLAGAAQNIVTVSDGTIDNRQVIYDNNGTCTGFITALGPGVTMNQAAGSISIRRSITSKKTPTV